MSKMTISEDGQSDPEHTCELCSVTFSISWYRNAYTTRIQYCPFCGSEITEVEYEPNG
jgi:hypothetical protein